MPRCLDESIVKLFTRTATIATIIGYIVFLYVVWHNVDFHASMKSPVLVIVVSLTITLFGLASCLIMTAVLCMKRYDLWGAFLVATYGTAFLLTVLLREPIIMGCAYVLWITSIFFSWCFCSFSPSQNVTVIDAESPGSSYNEQLEEQSTPLAPVHSRWERD